MKGRIGFSAFTFVILLLALTPVVSGADGKILKPVAVERQAVGDNSDPVVYYHGFHSDRCDRNLLHLEREKPWMLPMKRSATEAAAADPADTIRILAMRFDFEYEIPDDSSTTGRGQFDMRDTIAFFNDYGHLIDPSPHNRLYFEKHLEAMNNYYYHVSDSNLILEWDVYPRNENEAYHLPNEMAHYGAGTTSSEIIQNLVDSFFIDCFQLVDTQETELAFADYDAYILFHAGSDRQNDIGFPPTHSDLFTGYARRGDDREPLYVDDGTHMVSDAIIMPEMASQDNRATALNAVMVHEFGHQLGLVDLYRTDNFFTQLGDFALMDNNGFGTGVDLGFEFVGRVFGTMPVYMCAWSRAYLGFIEPVVFRQNADISLVASEMISNNVRIARIPISEYEYYLLENRQIDIDERGDPALLADSVTSVIMGPVYYNPADGSKTLNNEYDFLLPGSGILIFHVDESIAAKSLPGSSFSLFETNSVQYDVNHRFIELMEADGLINFGGYYYAGYGTQRDMYYAGNNSSFTPNTNPPSIGYNGTNSHIRITNISSSRVNMSLNLEYDWMSEGFPRRAGYPAVGFSPIAADIDGNGSDEIIAVSDNNLLVINQDGGGWFESLGFEPYYDTSYTTVGQTADSVPLFAHLSAAITSNPVYGDFGIATDTVVKFVGVGSGNKVYAYSLDDDNDNGQPDSLFNPIQYTGGYVLWMSFDTLLDVAVWRSTGIGLYEIDMAGNSSLEATIDEDIPYGFARMGSSIVAIAGDEDLINLHLITPDDQFVVELNDYYLYGPVTVDLDRDGYDEVIVATDDGLIKVVTVDLNSTEPFMDEFDYDLGDSIFANPVVADMDADGYADIIFCGQNKIYAFNRNFTRLDNFPITIDRTFDDLTVVSPPVVADIDNDGRQDIIFAASNGNCYAVGPDPLYGFPLALGGIGVVSIILNGSDLADVDFKNIQSDGYGSPVVYKTSDGGGLGYLGGDGWLYSWDVDYDPDLTQWPMYGGEPGGSNNFPVSKLADPATFAERFSDDKFYCYPNPTKNGWTTIRYFLGEPANVTLSFYDMVGDLVSEQKMAGVGGVPNEYNWNGSFLPTGVYRCVIEADFADGDASSFIDIAIIK